MDGIPQSRRFRERPNLVFITQTRDLIVQTGQPEAVDALYRAPIAKTEEFQRLTEIHIEPGRRPDGDRAPCPMCVPNKFLNGWLIYLPRLQAVAVIGHCCADKTTSAAADREYRERMTREQEETYLLAELPQVAARMRRLETVRPTAKEARHAFDMFQGRGEAIQRRLRTIKQRGGMLVLSEILDKEAVNDGPRGFGRAGNVRDVQFGALNGTTALLTAFNPIREMDKIKERLSRLERGDTEEAALNFIVTMSEAERAFACKELRDCDRGHDQLVKRLTDFASFFADENLRRLDAWGRSDLNPEALEVSSQSDGPNRIVRLIGSGCQVRIMIAPALWTVPQA